jgi:hypothetical protein
LEFDLDEQDIEQFKLKDSFQEAGWETAGKDPQNKQERRKLDTIIQISTTELPKAGDDIEKKKKEDLQKARNRLSIMVEKLDPNRVAPENTVYVTTGMD